MNKTLEKRLYMGMGGLCFYWPVPFFLINHHCLTVERSVLCSSHISVSSFSTNLKKTASLAAGGKNKNRGLDSETGPGAW